MKLTIVLTVYNKEPFLHRAMDALLHQEGAKCDDYEVLAVNDGSIDGSPYILKDYSLRDKRVRVLTQNNQGLSMARNNGVDASLGEYVWFVDADDKISPDAVSLICEAANQYPDIIPIYAQTEGIDNIRNAVKPDARTGKEIIATGHWEVCGVFNVFKKVFLKDNDLRFMPGIYHEDAEFTPRMLYKAKTVKVIPRVLYTVYKESNGITQVPRSKRAFDYIIVSESLSRFIIDNGEVGTPIGKAIDYVTAQTINNAFSIISRNSNEEQDIFNKAFYEKRETMLRVLKSAPYLKYRIEAFLFFVFPRHCTQVYRMMKLYEKIRQCKE